MIRTPTLAAIRFGTGLRADMPPPADGAAVFDSLSQERQPRFRVEPWPDRFARYQIRDPLRRATRSPDADPALVEQRRQAERALSRASRSDLRATIARMVDAPVGFHARLTWFWANHFCAQGQGPTFARGRAAYVEDAILPHVTGHFRDMLRAAVLHPVMLVYLDQYRSVGPNSPMGARPGRGLNENLAREILELHTLGVTGSYTQSDVTEFAKLLTGLVVNLEQGTAFDLQVAEPAIMTVLGQRYGGRVRNLDQITQALDDLVLNPDTARHTALKLARHFVSDTPDPALVAHVAAAFTQSQGALMPVYAALLEHPAAWAAPLGKVRAPMEWVAACARALGIPARVIMDLSSDDTRQMLVAPLHQMGEEWETVPSPAGHDDDSAYWVTSQRLAARVTWAMDMAQQWPAPRDPAAFVQAALADAASDPLRRAVMGAETRAQAIGVTLASPDFNRR
jgi:uncharacterized protein (DUF1800 family)